MVSNRSIACILIGLLMTLTAAAQTNGKAEPKRTITGRVVDETGEPMAGASVVARGGGQGTMADAEGRFSLQTPLSCDSLRIYYVGKHVKSIALSTKKSDYQIVARDPSSLLEDVVVTGYQSISKSNMTGAVETITSKDITDKGFTSVGDILRGQLAGVSTRLTSGKPGATPEIRIRGLNSLYGDMEPTWVVDGAIFRGNLNDLNPEEIESITVLKDAAATAIYGSQAANGVIVVERKKGQVGKTMVRASASLSLEQAPKSKLDLMNAEQKIAYERAVYEDFPTLASGGRVIQLLRNADLGKISHEEAEAEIARLSQINTNWYDEIFRSPVSQNYNVSVSGGTEAARYYTGIGFRQSQGLVPVNNYQNMSLSSRLDFQLHRKVKVAINLNLNNRKDDDTYAGTSVLSYATYANPYEQLYNEDGSYAYDHSYYSGQSTLKDGYINNFNIMRELRSNQSNINTLSGYGSLELNWDICKGLRYTTVASLNHAFSNTEIILAPGTETSRQAAWINTLYGELPDYLNNGFNSNRDTRNDGMTWSNRLQYGVTMKHDHNLSLFLGQEMAEFSNHSNYSVLPEYDDVKGLYGVPEIGPEQASYVQQMIRNLIDRSESKSRSASFFATGSYNFAQRYVLSTSARLDGSNVIGKKNRFSPLWNVSLRYNLAKEPWMKRCEKWLSMLSVRLSYGYTGSIDKNALPFNVLTYSISSTFLGETVPSFIRAKNPSIKWQKKQDRNIGLDFGLWHNRLQVAMNYYNNVTRDLLDQKKLPASTGLTTIKFNSSSVLNEGFEMHLQANLLRTKDIHWSANFNTAANRSKVLESYFKNIADVPKGYERTEPVQGTSTNSWVGYHYAGIDPLTGHTLAYVDNTDREVPIGFQREDGRWVIDMDKASDDEKLKIKSVLGKSYPPFSGGFGTQFTWRQITVGCHFSFMMGHQITSAYFASSNSGSISSAAKNVLVTEAHRWRKPGDVTDVPAYSTSGMSSSLRTDWYDRKLENGSYLKCSQITVSYAVPSAICQKAKLRSLHVNLNLRDLFTISPYKGLDPENFGGFGYPISRKVMINLSLGI